MRAGAVVAKKMRESSDSTHTPADIAALHEYVARKAVKAKPDATNLDFLEALMREIHSPEELAKFYADLEAEHAQHRERMARYKDNAGGKANEAADFRKIARGIALIAEAIEGTEHESPEDQNHPVKGK